MPQDMQLSVDRSAEAAVRDHDRQRRFDGILSGGIDGPVPREVRDVPDCFHDLRLDRIVGAIVTPFGDYDLASYFHAPLRDPRVIGWRHEVFHDLGIDATMNAVGEFGRSMREIRVGLEHAGKRNVERESQFWFLHAAKKYCRALRGLVESLRADVVVSAGLRAFREHLDTYLASTAFMTLSSESDDIDAAMSALIYSILIKDSSVTVQHYADEPDYTPDVEATFAKFRQGDARNYRIELPKPSGMNHIEAQILDRVALLNPAPFAALAAFCADHAGFLDPAIIRFDREIQFYVAYLGYMATFRAAGLGFCYPEVSTTCKEVFSTGSYDVALAARLIGEHVNVVCNDFHLQGTERIFVVSGPNNGGKTTFARTFGQLHYLASLGCPVPGASASLFLFDRMFTHFEREEDVATLRGKLEDDLFRMHEILVQATPSSIIVMNEIFASTTLGDAIWLGKKVMMRMSDLDLLGVCVTFLDELSTLNNKTVSIVSAIDVRDPAVRTYRLERRTADGLAFALAIADKHRVTHDQLIQRIAP